ncbi:MAG: hypothetical protein JWR69_2096 [Pedosphaera sp.]|nr:hypothetical protein [Pedosphaera sp.]
MAVKTEAEVKRIKPKPKAKAGKLKKDPNLAQGERSENALYDEDKGRKDQAAKSRPSIEDRTVG